MGDNAISDVDERRDAGSAAMVDRLRTCRACGHDLLTQHDPEDETCDAFAGMDVGVCQCGRSWVDKGGHRLSYVERLADAERRASDASQLAAILTDLDRCEHGRHEGDICSGVSGCNGPSHGNPIAAQHGRQVGYNISRESVRVPDRWKLNDPEAWASNA